MVNLRLPGFNRSAPEYVLYFSTIGSLLSGFPTIFPSKRYSKPDSASVKPFTKYIKPAEGILFHGPSSLSFKQLLKVKMLRSNKKQNCRDNFFIVLNRLDRKSTRRNSSHVK